VAKIKIQKLSAYRNKYRYSSLSWFYTSIGDELELIPNGKIIF